jgi:TRAP transporter TAXI family solute receptor
MKTGTNRMVFLSLVMVLTVFAAPALAYDLKWGTAPAGGLWQVLGTVMLEDVLKKNPAMKGSTVPIGGAANVIGVTENKLNLAFSFSDVAFDAWNGEESFKAKGPIRNIRALASLFPEPTQFAVFADSGIKDIPQLKGKKVTPGPKGSAVEVVTRRILAMYGITYNDVQVQMVSFGEGAQLMIDNHIDAILYGAMVLPTPGLVNVNSQRQIRLLSLSDEVIQKLVKTYKGLEPYTIPGNTYKGVDYPVKGIASQCNLIAREDMPEEVAYTITKSIAENFGRYQTTVKPMAMAKPEDMPKDAGIPFHPGALKYFKEKGWVK